MAKPRCRVGWLLLCALIYPGFKAALCINNGLARRPPMVGFCLLVILRPLLQACIVSDTAGVAGLEYVERLP